VQASVRTIDNVNITAVVGGDIVRRPPGGSSAGYRIYRLFPVSRRLEAERNALPIWVAYLPLTAVLLGDYPIKLERFAGIEVPRILPQMLTHEFAPQWADDWPVTNACM
jgi:hypothetical protein